MKIVFFGDSNTWGFDPATGARQKCRFINQLKEAHPEWEIIDEGLNGRTLADDDPYSLPRNGAQQISAAIRTHTPYDILVVMLGTNDAKRMFSGNTGTLEKALYRFLDEATNPALFRRSPYEPGKILLVQPPLLAESIQEDPFSSFGLAGVEMIRKAGPVYEKAARQYGIDFLATSGQEGWLPIVGGPCDGIHLEEEGHTRLARLLEYKLSAMQKEMEKPADSLQ